MTTNRPMGDYFKGFWAELEGLRRFAQTAIAGPGPALDETIRKLIAIETIVIRDCTIAAELRGGGDKIATRIHQTIINHHDAFWAKETPESVHTNVDELVKYLGAMTLALDGIFFLLEGQPSPLTALDKLIAQGDARRRDMREKAARAQKVGKSYIPKIPVPEKLPPIKLAHAVNWFLSHRPREGLKWITSGANGGDADLGTDWQDAELLRRLQALVGRTPVSYCPALHAYWAKPLKELIELLKVYIESPPGAALRQEQLWAWVSALPQPDDMSWHGGVGVSGGGTAGDGARRRFMGMDIHIPHRGAKSEPYWVRVSYRGQRLMEREFRAPRAVGIQAMYPQIEALVTDQLLHTFGLPTRTNPRIEGAPL